MIDYVNSKDVEALKPVVVELANQYQQQNSWSTIQGRRNKLSDILSLRLTDSKFTQPLPPDAFRGRPKEAFITPAGDSLMPPPRHRLPRNTPGYALLDTQKNLVVGNYDNKLAHIETAIIVEQDTVGWLVTPRRKQIGDGYELDFIEQQQSYLWIIALAVMVLVVIITLPLARHVVEPIKLIIAGMDKLTQGDYQQKIELRRKDELGELGRDFNELALTLHENDSARKRWLANISHELRTPVAILRGELEAMIDGVRPLCKENVDSANDEVKHLQHLIDDLHQLTSADIGGMHYRKKSEDLNLWFRSELARYHAYLATANIKLETNIVDRAIIIYADTTRLCQLFDNLINNCIKYAQASLVVISVEVIERGDECAVHIKVEDDGIGVADKHITHLFEHLYRVENSRNRKTGGSGLGLSICSHIVSAHQGKITAQRARLGGLAIVIQLPLSK